MSDENGAALAEADTLLRANVRSMNALLATGRLTPGQAAAFEAIASLTAQTLFAHDDANRGVLLDRLARASLIPTVRARQLLAIPETTPAVRQELVKMLQRRGEPIA